MNTPDELKTENEELKSTVAMKTDLIAVSAHELRTSLTALKWILKMFVDHELGSITDEQKDYIRKALEESDQMTALVTKLLTLNKGETETMHMQDTDIKKLVETEFGEFESLAHTAHTPLVLQNAVDMIPHVYCDPETIHIALATLIENAIKYSTAGETIDLAIHTDASDTITISIHNTGVTITKEEQAKIFTKFFRAKGTVDAHIPGSGLGLYIAKHIVECNHGTIWFESKPESGTTFFMSLPIARAVLQ
jgi:signal transduction histidine kinase